MRPALVVGCFSTALLTAAALLRLPVARIGTEPLLDRLTPYQNSNRVPVTIVDALLPDLADAAAVAVDGPAEADRTTLTGPGHARSASRCSRRSTRICGRRRRRYLGTPSERPHLALLQAPPADRAGAAGRHPGPAATRRRDAWSAGRAALRG